MNFDIKFQYNMVNYVFPNLALDSQVTFHLDHLLIEPRSSALLTSAIPTALASSLIAIFRIVDLTVDPESRCESACACRGPLTSACATYTAK